MSGTAPAPLVIGRKTRQCKFCRAYDHDLRNCDKWKAKREAEGWTPPAESAPAPAESSTATTPEPPPPLPTAPTELAEFEPEPGCSCGARHTGMVCICAMRGIVIEREPAPPVLVEVDPEIAAIAQLREELDGLEIETGQYRRVVEELEQRIDRNRTRAVTVRAEIALLRARRKATP
jgi:hypothetical protein